jgi:hypothetical protein
MQVISAHKRLGQEDHKFEGILGSIVSPLSQKIINFPLWWLIPVIPGTREANRKIKIQSWQKHKTLPEKQTKQKGLDPGVWFKW